MVTEMLRIRATLTPASDNPTFVTGILHGFAVSVRRKPHEPDRPSPVPEEGRARYWAAYRRGVQREVCGSFGVPDAERDRWISMHADQTNDERDGYAEGLRFGQLLVKI
jgi:hypothetical protein